MRPDPSGIILRPSCARDRDGLAGKPRADQIDRFQLGAVQRSEILVPRDVGPVLRQDTAAERIDLDLP